MRVQIQAQPSGFSLPIPAAFASALHLTVSTELEVNLVDGMLTITPPPPRGVAGPGNARQSA